MRKRFWSSSAVWADRAARALIGLAVACAVWAASGEGRAAAEEPAAASDTVAPEALWDAIHGEKPPLVIDVRAPEAFAKLRIPRSQNLREPEGIAALTPAEGQLVVLVAGTEEQARAVAAGVKAPKLLLRVLRGGLGKWPCGLEMSAEELHGRLQREQPPKLIDVRTVAEYAACRIEGTLHHPLDQIETWGPDLSKTEEIVLVCRTGRRSGLAQEWLARHGFRHVHNLLGGTSGWTYGWTGTQCPP